MLAKELKELLNEVKDDAEVAIIVEHDNNIVDPIYAYIHKEDQTYVISGHEEEGTFKEIPRDTLFIVFEAE